MIKIISEKLEKKEKYKVYNGGREMNGETKKKMKEKIKSREKIEKGEDGKSER